MSAFRFVGMFSRQCSLTWAGMIQQNYKRADKVHVYRADKKQFTHKQCKDFMRFGQDIFASVICVCVCCVCVLCVCVCVCA